MEQEDCAMADKRGCSLGAAGLAFVTRGVLARRRRCCWHRSLVVSPRGSCEDMRDEPNRVFMSWPIKPMRVWMRRWTRVETSSTTRGRS